MNAQDLARADNAMSACLARADRLNAGLWSAKANEMLARFLKTSPFDGGPNPDFLTEHFFGWAIFHGMAVPPDARAIGGIMRAAARSGIIVRAGYKADRWSSIKTVWRAA